MIPVLFLDPEAQVLHANAAAGSLLGCSPNDDSLCLFSLVPGQEHSLRWSLEEVLRTGGLEEELELEVFAAGHRRVLAFDMILQQPAGPKSTIVAILKDLTASIEEEERRHRCGQLAGAMNEIYQYLVREKISLDEIAGVTLEWAKHLTRSEWAVFLDFDAASGEPRVLARRGKIPLEVAANGDEGLRSLARRAAETGRPFFSNDPAAYAAPHRFLAMPVLSGGKIVGQVLAANSPRPYGDSQLELVGRLVDYYSVAFEKEKSRQRLEESECRFRNVLENIDEYVYSIEFRNGVPSYHFHNRKSLAVTGYLPEEFDADPNLWLTMIHEDDRNAVLAYLDGIRQGKTLPPIEHRIVRKDGVLRWVLNTSTIVFADDGSPLRTQGFIIDMHQRVLVESSLKEAKDAAETANKAKSEFLASMSHELRTPLNSILGFCQLLTLDGAQNLNPQQKEYLLDIKAAGEHLLGMISDVLDLAKIEAGKIDLQKRPFDLSSSLRRLVETMRSPAQKSNIGLEAELASDLGILDADEGRVRQVLYNLLSNAIKFTEPGKRVGLEAHGEGGRAVITVWDEGIGIAEAEQKRVFAPFEQIRNTKLGPNGTGLGLSIARQLVELHEGEVQLFSELGRGSRFTVTFPGRIQERRNALSRSRPERPAFAAAGVTPPSLDEGGILVVEDNPINRKLILAVLDSFGYQAKLASSGEEAVRFAREEKFALILMDVNLPGIDGVEAMKQIRGLPRMESCNRRTDDLRTAIVGLTAHVFQDSRSRFIAEGMDDVLAKPIDLDKLKGILDLYLPPPREAYPRLDPVGSPFVPEPATVGALL